MAHLPINASTRSQIKSKSKIRSMNVESAKVASKRINKAKTPTTVAAPTAAATTTTTTTPKTKTPAKLKTTKKVTKSTRRNIKQAQTSLVKNNNNKTLKPKATYLEMIQAAIRALADPRGSSRVKIFKWIQSNNELIDNKLMSFRGNMAMKKGLETGLLKNGKSSGMFKIGDKQKEQDKVKAKTENKAKTAIKFKKNASSPAQKKESNLKKSLTLTAKKLVKKSTKKQSSIKSVVKKGRKRTYAKITSKIAASAIAAAAGSLNKPVKSPRLPPKPRILA